MTTRSTTFDNPAVSDGDVMTTTNTNFGGQTPWSGSSSLAGCTFSAAAAAHGPFGMRCQAASGVNTYGDWPMDASTTASGRIVFTARTPSATTQNVQLRAGTPTSAQSCGVNYNSSGILNFLDASGTTRSNSPALTPGNKYQLFMQVTSDATAGSILWRIYNDADGSLHSSGSFTGQNTKGGNLTNAREGKIGASTDTGTWDFDSIMWVGGTLTWLALAVDPPTAAFTDIPSGLTVAFDGTGSAGGSGATIADPAGYAWDFGDGNTGTGSAPSHTYSAASTYTVTLTVTDSNGNTDPVSHTVTVAGAVAVGPYASIATATSATPSAGSGTSGVLACLSDGNQATYVDCVNGAVISGGIVLLIPPATGQPAVAVFAAQAASAFDGTTSNLAASAVLTVKLIEVVSGTPTTRGTTTVNVEMPAVGAATPPDPAVHTAMVCAAVFPWTGMAQNVTNWANAHAEIDVACS